MNFTSELKVDKESFGGCGGIIGRKKGAVAIRINYKGIRMVFISCHLAGNYINTKKKAMIISKQIILINSMRFMYMRANIYIYVLVY